MLVSELDFELPPHLIAQRPASPRDSARLLHARCADLARGAEALEHGEVRGLPSLLRPGDLVVVNDSRVLRARLRGSKAESGGRVEALLLREVEPNLWESMLRPAARLKPGTQLRFEPPGAPGSPGEQQFLTAEAVRREGEGWLLRFASPEAGFDVRQVLVEFGEVPLPPYIQALSPEEDYQTVYAHARGERVDEEGALDSCAAPTAGLHFTPELMGRLGAMGVEVAKVTLGVGPGTFRPVQSETLEEHAMHSEEFFISPEVAARINAQRASGGRVVAIGTTSARALESAAGEGGVRAGRHETRLFVRPGYEFQVIDALMTNFHLPRSTLLALVAAWAQHRARRDGVMLEGLACTQALYASAIGLGYRFFSFGDAMLLD